MKKIGIVASTLALLIVTGSFLFTDHLSAYDPDLVEKTNTQRTLHILGFDVDTDSIASSQAVKNKKFFTDENGDKWIYLEYTDKANFIEDMFNYYDEEFVQSLMEVQAQIMRKHSQVGDYIPIILLDEDLQKGSFSFTRDNGETLSFPIHYESIKGWVYEEPILFESAR